LPRLSNHLDTTRLSDEELHHKYEEIFGVSEDELRQQGLDPREYALEKLRRARQGAETLGSPTGPAPQSAAYRLLWVKWGRRAFRMMFVGIGFLALSRFSPLHWFGLVAADITVVIVGWMVTMALSYRRKYVSMCRRLGVQPQGLR
jgi:hypothetical protein